MRLLAVLTVLLTLISNTYAFASSQFVYCSESAPSTISPILGTDMTAGDVGRHLYSTLLESDRKTSELVPSLAESWTISPDGLTYTFKIRKGVAFHETEFFKPTRPLNAEDVVFSIDRMLNKRHPFHKVKGGNYPNFYSFGLPEYIKALRKTGEYEVTMELKKPMVTFLEQFAFVATSAIYSAEYGAQLLKNGNLEDIDNKPIGSGPFAFQEMQADSFIRFRSHEKYFKGAPEIKKLIFAFTPDASVRKQKLIKGECDLIFQPNLQDVTELEKNPNIQLHKRTGINLAFLAMNVEKRPYDNPLVRQAIAHALDRDKYIKTIYMGKATKPESPLPAANWSRKGLEGYYAYLPWKAKELLKKAGYGDGFKTKLWALPVTRVYMPNGRKLAEMMQADLKAVGIEAEIVTFDWATYLAKAAKGEHELLQIGYIDASVDPDSFLFYNLSCQSRGSGDNSSRWCEKTFDAKISSARSILEREARKVLYDDAQLQIAKDMPLVPLARGNVMQASGRHVKGYVTAADGSVQFFGVSVQK